MERGTRALSVVEFEVAANETDALIIDTRKSQTFNKGFIPNSINISIDGSFATWVGTLVPSVKQQILVVADEIFMMNDVQLNNMARTVVPNFYKNIDSSRNAQQQRK